MILGFTKVFTKGPLKGWETNFKQKILAGTKIHSMRKDIHNRWRVGMSMQLAHCVRTNLYDHFSTQVCKRIQLVKFVYADGRKEPKVYIDGRELGIMEQIMLAMNDGFDSFAQFLQYFNENGDIKLLHWTDYIYDGNRDRLQAVNDKRKNIYAAGIRDEEKAINLCSGPMPIAMPCNTLEPGRLNATDSNFAHEWLKSIGAEPEPLPEALPEVVLGLLPDDVCGREGCTGIIKKYDSGSDRGCTCFVSAPCSYCVDNRVECPQCGWEAGWD